MKLFLITLISLLALLLLLGCTQQLSRCENMDKLSKALCYLEEARLQKNPNLCYNISDSNFRKFCIEYAFNVKESAMINDINFN